MPCSTFRSTTDVDVYRQTIRPLNAEFLVTGRGQFAGQVTKIDLHHLWMQSLVESLPRIWQVVTNSNRIGIWFQTAPGFAFYADGIELKEAELGLLVPTTAFWHRASGPSRLGSMSLPIAEAAELSVALTGRELDFPGRRSSMQVSPSAMERLRRLHDSTVQLARTAPEIVANPDAARGLEQALVGAMFACLPQAEVQEDKAGKRRHSAIARRFHAFAAKHPEEPVYLAEVCAAIGVNERTLRICCMEQLGASPKRYLQLRRMHLAHRALLQPPDATTTVTEIATRFGFWELGRFAVAYKSLFGESPSATLGRAGDVHRPTPNQFIVSA